MNEDTKNQGLLGAVDHFGIVDEKYMVISGWAVNVSDGLTAEKVFLANKDNQIIAECISDVLRPDLPDKKGFCFKVTAETILLNSNDSIKVYIYDQGKYFLINEKKINRTVDGQKKYWNKYLGIDPPMKMYEKYKTCKFIDSMAVFSAASTTVVCCDGPWEPECSTRRIVGEITTNQPFPIKELLLKRKEMIDKNKIGVFDGCRGCSLLREKYYIGSKYLLTNVNLSHYFTCNLKCKFCFTSMESYVRPIDTPGELMVQSIKYLLENEILDPNGNIDIAGGEPALMSHVHEFFAVLDDYNVSVNVCTNGAIFSQPIYNYLKQNPQKTILMISADSAVPQTYEEMKGVNCCDKVWENIKKYSTATNLKDRLKIKMIITDDNVNEVKEFIDKVESCGLNTVVVDFDRMIHDDERSPKIYQAIKLFVKYAREKNMTCLFGHEKVGFILETMDK